MNKTASVNKLSQISLWIISIILLLLPFHAFITVWLSSLIGHYTLLRLWKEFLLLPLIVGATYRLFSDAKLRKKFSSLALVKLIFLYALVLGICGFVALARHTVTAKALWYGLLVDLRFLIFFLAVMVLAAGSDKLYRNWQKVLFIPAIFVAAFAVLQYLVLPYDFLKHFGYNSATIYPYETINHNLNHIRVASTLRGANPLGAYLVISICALAVWLFKEKRERLDKIVFGLGLLIALVFSFSRSAWIGAVVGIAVVAWLSFKSDKTRRQIAWASTGLVVLAAVLGLILRNNISFENAFLHTDKNSKIALSSNQGHSAAAKAAIKDIAHHPLGSGVGTAGPQSVYNNNQTKISENYFLQIGQEAGVIGMLLFIAICVSIGRILYNRRADPLALALLASLLGLSLVNFLSHAWADDTLAYVWWGLAGICLSPVIIKDIHKQKDAKIPQKKS